MFFIEEVKKLLNLFNEKKEEKTKRLPAKLKYKQSEEIIIPEGVKVIDSYMFMDFKNLKRIVLPSTIKKIGDGAFTNCSSLEEIIIPDSVDYIGYNVFNNCISLKKVIFPSNMEKIYNLTFYNCSSLEEITIPDKVKDIGALAFCGCENLKKVKCGTNLKHIDCSSFKDCTSLKDIIFTSNELYIKDNAFENCLNLYIHNHVSENLLEYVNKISRKKYNSFEEIAKENKELKDIINYVSLISSQGDRKYNIKKFKELFYKTRVKDMVSFDEFKYLTLEQAKTFDYKLYKEIKKYIGTLEEPSSFINFMSILGLFENDKDIDKRKDLFIKLIRNNKCFISLENITSIKDFLENFEPIIKQKYVLNENYEIPNEFSLYLDKVMYEDKVIKLKKVNGTFGSHLNKFIRNKYSKEDVVFLKLKDSISDENRETISKLIYNNNFNNIGLNKGNINVLFNEIDPSYNKEFFNFLITNLELILLEIKKLDNFSEIKDNFKEIKKFYLKTGKEKINIYDCIKYIDVYRFKQASFGDQRFINYLKDSGAPEESFGFYKKKYQKVKSKYKTTLPDTDLTFHFNDEKIRIRRLECNDPLQIFIGEENYTNCCQMYNHLAENCIEGIVESNSMGVTIVELVKDNYSILLAQSLDWTRNGVYCHDNIEGTEFLDSNKDYQEAVLKAYEYQAKEIIKKSKETSLKYLEKQKGIPEMELKKLKETIENQTIKVVVVGDSFCDVDVDGLEELDSEINDINSEYCCYSDAGYKKVIYGNENEIDKKNLFSSEPEIEMFKENRKINIFDESNITDEEMLKMFLIEKNNDKTNYIVFNNNESFSSFCDKLEIDSSKCKIVLGEDWYMVYSINQDEITIHDLKNGFIRDKEEKLSQLIEIKNALLNIVKENNNSLNIKTYIDKKSTYQFYLNCIKKEIIKENSIDKKDNNIFEVNFSLSDKYVRKIFSRK